jgi:hypothetical protein
MLLMVFAYNRIEIDWSYAYNLGIVEQQMAIWVLPDPEYSVTNKNHYITMYTKAIFIVLETN